MAGKADFTEGEWHTLQQGVTGAGLLVSLAPADLIRVLHPTLVSVAL